MNPIPPSPSIVNEGDMTLAILEQQRRTIQQLQQKERALQAEIQNLKAMEAELRAAQDDLELHLAPLLPWHMPGSEQAGRVDVKRLFQEVVRTIIDPLSRMMKPTK